MQEDVLTFVPPRRGGVLFHVGALAGVGAALLWLGWRVAQGPLAVQLGRRLPLMVALLLALFVLLYTLRALQGAAYHLSRDGLVLHWGLREVSLSACDVLWVSPLDALGAPLPVPWIRWPGAWLGRAVRRSQMLGRVEYLAAGGRHLLAIGTPQGTYVISPQRPADFLQAFVALSELGSTTPLPTRSLTPGDWLGTAWRNRTVRLLWMLDVFVFAALWLLTLWGISSRTQVSLGFTPGGQPRAPLPATSLILLPVLYTFFVLLDWVSGQFFFQSEEMTPLAYVLWSAGVLTGIGFLAGLVGILW
ncbi:MAG: hypothetical protein Fur0018_17090 [Anaerolineales bacterium]